VVYVGPRAELPGSLESIVMDLPFCLISASRYDFGFGRSTAGMGVKISSKEVGFFFLT